jgi:hypothetical protein
MTLNCRVFKIYHNLPYHEFCKSSTNYGGNADEGGVGRGFGTFGLILLSGLQKKGKIIP